MKGISAFSALLLVVLFLQSGCDSNYDNPLETQKIINVSGRVKGGVFNEGLPDAKIRIDDKVTYTNQYGYFNISEVKTPYTVYITDLITNSGCIYDGLTEPECHLKFFSRQSLYSILANISYSYSGNATSNAKKLFFTDGKNISGTGGINEPGCSVYLPDNTPVTGKAFLLLYSTGLQGEVVSYDKFGIIDNVVIVPNSNVSLTFNDSICNIIPGSVRVSGTVNIPYPQVINNVALSTLYFSNRMFTSYVNTVELQYIYGNSFDILIPSYLGVNFYPVIWINFYNQSTFASCKSYYSLPKTGGTGLTLNVPKTPDYVYPFDLSTINLSTPITIGYAGDHIIYEYKFTDSVKTVMYYTRSNQVSLENMSKLGIGSFVAGSVVTFSATELGQFDYLDDFVNTSRNNLLQSTSFPVSRKYYFNP